MFHELIHKLEEGDKKYDASKIPVVAINFAGNVMLMVADPDMVTDLLVKKNNLFDKTGNTEAIFKKLLGSSFLFSRADEEWKKKRKACAHAFYKERLVHMLEILKDKIGADCERWSALIADSPDAQTTIDLSTVFNNLFS